MKLGVVMYMYAKYCVIAVRGFLNFQGGTFWSALWLLFSTFTSVCSKSLLCVMLAFNSQALVILFYFGNI